VNRGVDRPFWSPNATHIVYEFLYLKYGEPPVTDIYRATSSGGDQTELTPGSDVQGGYPKWRGTGNPPIVTITQPADGAEVWGTVTITATATDDGTVSEVEFFVDGTSVGTDTESPFQMNWSSSGVSDGDHTISATATDDDGETGSDSVVVTVDNVDDPPVVSITDPEDGDTVSGTSVTITASATDDGSVVKVDFLVDGSLVGTDYSAPYAIAWDSTDVSDGSHTILAKATDDASTPQTGTDSISVTVDNAPDPLSVTSISPDSVRAGKSVDVTVKGAGFATGAELTLENGEGPAVTVSNLAVVDSATITATIAADRSVSKGTWPWDVVVTNPSTESATLTDGFTVWK
jgi:hypothetical protein